MESQEPQEVAQNKAVEETQPQEQREPTVIFLFNLKSWYEQISPLSKIDLIDIAPLVSTQFYIDYGVQAYVLILTKGKWVALDPSLRKKFMFISCRIKQEMESPMSAIQREQYENSDIFDLLISQQVQEQKQSIESDTNIDLETIKECDEEETINVPDLL